MEKKVLTRFYGEKSYVSLKGYMKKGGYEVFKKALKKEPSNIISLVKESGLRGRGGAGFSAGLKWSFLPKNGKKRFLLCNADEGEPGTFKDRFMMDHAPHQLIEGMLISAYAIESSKSYIYIRGEYAQTIKILEKAIREAYDEGLLGKNIAQSKFSHDLDIYIGAGAYICGEETGMISSLEGKKGQPKLKPPFPAVEGYLGLPTIVNNVETLASVISIVDEGVEAYRKLGTQKSPGTKLFSVSGDINKPGVYEVELGYPLKKFIEEECGGMINKRALKAVIPGGSSAPVLTAQEVEKVCLDYESLSEAGSMLGSGGIIILDETRCMVECLKVILNFYHHESCGQCTPCREGTGWLHKLVKSIYSGYGSHQDISLITQVSEQMMGKTICALSDAAALPALSFLKKFEEEFKYFVYHGRAKKSQKERDLNNAYLHY